MRFADVRRHPRLPRAALALLLCAIVLVPADAAGGAAGRAVVGKVKRVTGGGVTINRHGIHTGDPLHSGDLISAGGGGKTFLSFSLKVKKKGTACQTNVRVRLEVVPDAARLIHFLDGGATCSTSPKGQKKKFLLGRDVTVTTTDPVFEVAVGKRSGIVRLRRGVAVVSGRKGKGVVVALNLKDKRYARQVVVPLGKNPRPPQKVKLTRVEQTTFAQLASALPPVTDLTPPTTTLGGRPGDPTPRRDASFTFSGGTVYGCAIDGGMVFACTSPQPYTLPPGRHTFSVRATDQAGNTGPAVSYSWTIERSASAKIAFESDRSGDFQVFTMNPDGSGQRPLTSPPHQSFDPAWSPDGGKLVFESNRATYGRSQLYVMDADGSDQTRLTTSPAGDRFPKWSPDGAKIAFEGNLAGDTEIYVIDADGTGRTKLTAGAGKNADPVWSPDGTKIAFDSSRNGKPQIYVMNANGSGQKRLTSNPASDVNPAWSPDGAEIAFESDRDGKQRIYVMDADGGNQQRLTSVDEYEFHPTWSPDGTRIAFAEGQAKDTEISVVNRDGSGQRRLTNSRGQNLVPNW